MYQVSKNFARDKTINLQEKAELIRKVPKILRGQHGCYETLPEHASMQSTTSGHIHEATVWRQLQKNNYRLITFTVVVH